MLKTNEQILSEASAPGALFDVDRLRPVARAVTIRDALESLVASKPWLQGPVLVMSPADAARVNAFNERVFGKRTL